MASVLTLIIAVSVRQSMLTVLQVTHATHDVFPVPE